jgi:hypothetical protein
MRAYAEAGVDQVIYLVFASTPAALGAEIEKLGSELLPVAAGLAPRRRGHH